MNKERIDWALLDIDLDGEKAYEVAAAEHPGSL